MSRFIGGGYVFYFVVSLPEMSADAAIVARWWTPVAVIVAFLPGWSMLAATFPRPRAWTNTALALACSLGYLIALILWFVAWNGEPLAADRATWLALFPGLASLSLVVGRWPWLAGLHLIVATAAVYAANDLTDPSPDATWIVAGGVIWAIAFSAVFVAAGIMAVRTGDVLDTTRDRAYRIAADAAAQLARDGERARYDALVHDRVLAVLLNVRGDRSDHRLAKQARHVVLDLDTVADVPSDPVDGRELTAVVKATITEIDPTIPVTGPILAPDADAIVVPGTAVHALANAAAEAVRNSARHAGTDATIDVHVEASDRSVTVTVLDTGRGFDLTAVPRDRMGVAVSIRDRMAAAGGRASVLSSPGGGTRVTLVWPSWQ
jgi:signal transduction histidine kinase